MAHTATTSASDGGDEGLVMMGTMVVMVMVMMGMRFRMMMVMVMLMMVVLMIGRRYR